MPSLWQTCIWLFFILVFCQAKRADNLGLIGIIKAKKNTISTFNNEYYLQSQYFFFLNNHIDKCSTTTHEKISKFN